MEIEDRMHMPDGKAETGQEACENNPDTDHDRPTLEEFQDQARIKFPARFTYSAVVENKQSKNDLQCADEVMLCQNNQINDEDINGRSSLHGTNVGVCAKQESQTSFSAGFLVPENVPLNLRGRENFHLTCDPCQVDETEEPAVGFCVTCAEYLCQQCLRDHKKNKGTRNHTIAKENWPVNTSVFKLMKQMVSCPDHPDWQISHKCVDHKVFVCVYCIAGCHRKCENVTELLTENYPCKQMVNETGAKLEELMQRADTIVKLREENIDTLKEEKQTVKEKCATLVRKMQDILIRLQETAILKVDNSTSVKTLSFRNDIEICKGFENDLNLFRQLLSTTEVYGTGTDLRIVADQIQYRLMSMEERVQQQEMQGHAHLHFSENPALEMITSLGKLKFTYDKSELNSSINQGERRNKVGSSSAVLTETTPGFESQNKLDKSGTAGDSDLSVTSYQNAGGNREAIPSCDNSGQNIKQTTKKCPARFSGNENTCSVVQCAVIQGGHILLLDQANRKLKVIGSGLQQRQCSKDLEDIPNDMCKVNDTNFAVVYKDLKQIDIFKISEKKIVKDKTWKTKDENLRITVNDEYLVILCKSGGETINCLRIQLRRFLDAKVMLEVTPFEGLDKLDCFHCSLASCTEGIIAVFNHGKVVCLCRKALETLVVKWQLDLGTNVGEIRGITIKKMHMYICSPGRGAVYRCPMPSAANTSLQCIAENLPMPVSVVSIKKNSQLLVGCMNNEYLHIVSLD